MDKGTGRSATFIMEKVAHIRGTIVGGNLSTISHVQAMFS